MKCPNCSAECADQSSECDFCGHPFVEQRVEQMAVTDPPVVMAIEPDSLPPANLPSQAPPPPMTPYQNPSEAPASTASIPNHMVWAIASTVIGTIVNLLGCCCLPVTLPAGIAAIVYASKVNKFLEASNIAAAEQAAKSAKLWCWITTGLGIFFAVLFVLSTVLQAMGYMDKDYFEDLRKQLEAGR